MRTRYILLLASALGVGVATIQAGPRTSVNYSIATDSADSGGSRGTSASYTNDGSAGPIAGLSNVASPTETVKAGYVSQLYEVAGFVVSASPSTLNEDDARQLDAWQLLDDATYLSVNPTNVTWSVLSGPIASISTGGLATAGIVYQNTGASVRGIYEGTPSLFNLTVLNVTTDDFGSYAGDGIGDDWQVQYFGLPPNLAAGPLLDPDGDGQDNRFEFTAGLVPTDPTSRFALTIAPVPDPMNPGQSISGQANLIFSPRLDGRTYTVEQRANLLSGTWTPLPIVPAPPQSDNGDERTVTDENASGSAKFYRVSVQKP